MTHSLKTWILAHWHGRNTLARSLWCIYVPVTVIAFYVYIRSFGSDGMIDTVGLAAVVQKAWWAALAAAWIWALVGTFNSAGQHVARGGNPRWKKAARAFLIATAIMPPLAPVLMLGALVIFPMIFDFQYHG